MIGATATELARMIAARGASAREVVEAHLARIEAVDGDVNAVVQVDGDRALAAAERDATVVARMNAAGAILLGKTNCPEYGGGIETDNAVYGFGEPARRHGTMNVPGEIDPTSWTTPHSLTGWPAATVRAGQAGPLPICVQVVAGRWRDDVALGAALRIERELA